MQTPRRKDRILTNDTEIKSFIKHSPSGVFSFVTGDQPYLNANLFIYAEEESCIYFHTAGPSTVKEIVQRNNNACFLIYETGRFLPGPKAVDLSVEYTSVIVTGKVELVTAEEKIMSIFSAYIQKYFPELKPGDYQPFTFADAMKATMYKLNIDRITAKQNKKPADFPGALHYDEKGRH
jgi:nitroimidazol reductase NimA-like FMN-containing flavoprotein (pyridoxamine 5'-phosphate oxidase superfamily)